GSSLRDPPAAAGSLFEGKAVTAGPDPVDWLAALFRGFHPVRWLLCLVGLVLTGLSAIVAQSFFEQGPPDLPGWWQQPNDHLLALWTEICGGSLGRIILRGAPLLALNAMLWCLIGGWIARHELLARRRARGDNAEDGEEPSIPLFLARRCKSLLVCCPVTLSLALVLLLPVLVAGWVNTWMGSPGAIIVSILLPVVLLADLIFMLIAAGAIAWPFMPLAIAAEGGDQFDALSRSYSYLYQRPIRFLLLTACAVGLAGLPLIALYCLAEQMAAWQLETRWAVCALAAGLSASIFWSLQTLVYLHLRLAVDGVDANEVAVELPPKESKETASPNAKAAAASLWKEDSAAGGQRVVRGMLLALVATTGSWCLTYWLFNRASQGPAEWLGWGLTGTLMPPAQGVYRGASLMAGFWCVVWLVLPVVMAVRRRLRAGETAHS
ncbi:MAG TPA: hypothetical protein VGZ47_17835, partial [Gemmataceae bacterium]|nr:hypothetical protein [Gemmataceae bacterium]